MILYFSSGTLRFIIKIISFVIPYLSKLKILNFPIVKELSKSLLKIHKVI